MALKPEDEAALADVKRAAIRRTAKVLVGAGAVLIAVGIGLVALGATYEHPHERIASRSVPEGAEVLLIVVGIITALGGLLLVYQALRGRGRGA